MTKHEKKALLQACIDLVAARAELSRTAMESAQAAANEEGKSSMGDKYETTRATMQAETDRHGRQLAENSQALAILERLPIARKFVKAEVGAVVTTEAATYFIAVGLGQIQHEGKPIFVVSPLAPVGKALQDKKPGDSFVINGKTQKVVGVW